MKRLVTSSEAAAILGLSLQGIHYRIKKGQLESVKKEGKTYVYVDNNTQKNQHTVSNTSTNTPFPTPQPQVQQNGIDSTKEIVKAKDEQIATLKKSIKFLKRQYLGEISRLEKNQDKILKVFQSEVDLLKGAFNEMQNIYKLEYNEQSKKEQYQEQNNQPEIKEEQKVIYDPINDHTNIQFMNIKDFYRFMKQYNKSDHEIKKIILDRVRNGDKRFIYNKHLKEVIITKSDFIDLI